MAGVLTHTPRVFARNLLRGNRREEYFFSYFVLIPDLGYEPTRIRTLRRKKYFFFIFRFIQELLSKQPT